MSKQTIDQLLDQYESELNAPDPNGLPQQQQQSETDENGDVKVQLQNVQKSSQRLEQMLQTNVKEQAQSEILAQLMSDPDFAALFRAKQSGQKVKIGPADELTNNGDTPAEPSAEDLDVSDGKNLKNFIVKTMRNVTSQIVRESLQPVIEKVQQTERFVRSQQQATAKTTIEATAKEFPDFWDYKEEMVRLNQENPNLTPRQLYTLAKIEKGQQPERDLSLEQERPSSNAARSRLVVNKTGDPTRDMRNLLRGAVQRVVPNVEE